MRQRPGHRPDSAGVSSSQAYFGRPPYKNHDVYANSGVGGMSSGSGASTSQAASYDGFGEDGAAGEGEAYFGSQCQGSGSASGSAVLGTYSAISKHQDGSRKSSGQYSNQKRGSQAGGSSSGGNSKFTPKRGYANEEIKDEDLMVEPVDLNDVNPASNFVTNNRRQEELGGGKRGSGKGKVRTVKKRDVKFANQGDAAPAGRGGHRGGRGGYNKSQQADDTKHNDRDLQEEGGSELLSSESPSGPAEASEKLRSQGDLEQVANEGGAYGSIFNQDPMLLYNCPPTH